MRTHLVNRSGERRNALVERRVTQPATEAPCRDRGVEDVLAVPCVTEGEGMSIKGRLPGVRIAESHSSKLCQGRSVARL